MYSRYKWLQGASFEIKVILTLNFSFCYSCRRSLIWLDVVVTKMVKWLKEESLNHELALSELLALFGTFIVLF